MSKAKTKLGTFLPSYYDEDYFENGIKSNYPGYKKEILLPRAREFISEVEGLLDNDNPIILILGCAKAFIVEAFLEKNHETYGQDISRYALKNATPYVKNVLTLSTITHLPYRDKTFSLIFAIDTLEHLEKSYQKQILSECYRVLLSKGLLVMGHPCGGEEVRKIELKEQSHQTIESTEWWIDQLTQVGFQVEDWSNPFYRTYFFQSRKLK